MELGDIDLVYLWCDMEDPAFRTKRNETLAKWGKAVDLTSNADCRAIARDELRFSLRSVELYAPWINRVFVVMNDESTPPGWLRTDRPDLRVVKLSEILPPEYLPCYCSDTIEHHLWRIPGLSKRFLYANDDMMFGKPTSPDFFFASDGKPICRFGSLRTVRKGSRLYTTYHACMENAETLVRDAFGLHGDFARAYGHSPHHNIDAYDRDDMQECFERVAYFENEGKLIEAQRIKQRTVFSSVHLRHLSHFARSVANLKIKTNTKSHCMHTLFSRTSTGKPAGPAKRPSIRVFPLFRSQSWVYYTTSQPHSREHLIPAQRPLIMISGHALV